ncbi:MAG: methyltransferase domain-containing protein [Alphaproteobacteria bacterium]|nr:methyltransferase domain-containing protein [Alphaproteobacteria bacterium]
MVESLADTASGLDAAAGLTEPGGLPDSFFERMRALGVGLREQMLLDLGTGTGAVALRYAQRGAAVSGIDISEERIEQAKERAQEARLNVDYQVAPAEKLPFEEHIFDVATAHQCWPLFDAAVVSRQVKWVLKEGGLLVTSHSNWLPDEDKIARSAEEIIVKFKPDWPVGWHGVVQPLPGWAVLSFRLRGMFYYDADLPFTPDSWREYLRARLSVSPGGGVEPLAEEALESFEDELHEMMKALDLPDRFTVRHRIDAHLLEPI